MKTKTTITSVLTGLFITLSGLIIAFWISWHALAAADFAFSPGYDLLEVDKHIQRYGPQNRYRRDFAQTDREQHMRLFSEIVHGIQNGGNGLDTIRYQLPSGRQYTLLREAEVIHLKDVANLITLFNQVSIVCLVSFAALVFNLYWKKRPPPGLTQVSLGLLSLAIISGLTLLIVGPTETFYWLHTQIFPKNHQWFFYYQESLMTTLMKAPDLFGLIAAVWATFAILLFALMQMGLKWLLQQTQPAATKTQKSSSKPRKGSKK